MTSDADEQKAKSYFNLSALDQLLRGKRDNGEENDDNIVKREYFVYGQKKERYFT